MVETAIRDIKERPEEMKLTIEGIKDWRLLGKKFTKTRARNAYMFVDTLSAMFKEHGITHDAEKVVIRLNRRLDEEGIDIDNL